MNTNASMSGCWSARISELAGGGRQSRRATILACVLILGLSGCGSGIPRVTPDVVTLAQRRDPTLDANRLNAIRTLYVNRCSSCHSLNSPSDYDEAEWATWMRKMAPKAKMDSVQEREVLLFILAARESAAVR